MAIEQVRTKLTSEPADTAPELGVGLIVDGYWLINAIEEPRHMLAVHELKACQYSPGVIAYDVNDVQRAAGCIDGLDLRVEDLRQMSAIELLIYVARHEKHIG